MRRVGIAAALVLACSSVPRDSAPPVELCRSAFSEDWDGSDAAGWLVAPLLLPLVWIFGPERIFDWMLSAAEPAVRRYSQQQLRLLHRAAGQGHLPSRYLLASRSGSLRGWEPPLEGVLSEAQVQARYLELAGAGFPPAEAAAAEEAAAVGFKPYQRRGGESEYFYASKRWQFFGLATRAALRGSRVGWSLLASRYGDLIDRFESSPEDRAQGYAWTYLATTPVYDVEREPNELARAEERRKAAWARLRDDAERDRAQELARRYEAEIFPRLLPGGERGICSVEPQFRGSSVEIPVVYNPVRLPPPYAPRPRPTARQLPMARPPLPPAQPPPPVPPPGVMVVLGQLRTPRGGEPSELLIHIPPEQSGLLERFVAHVRDAGIFAEADGFLGLSVDVQSGGDERGAVANSVFYLSGPQWLQRELSFPVPAGSRVKAYCVDKRASTGSQRERNGCTVDLELWIRPSAGP